MKRLTNLEKEMLQRAAAFALAGEWPWEDGDAAQDERTQARERAALESAMQKLGLQ